MIRIMYYEYKIHGIFAGNCTQPSSGVASTAGSTPALSDLPRYPWMALTGGNYTVFTAFLLLFFIHFLQFSSLWRKNILNLFNFNAIVFYLIDFYFFCCYPRCCRCIFKMFISTFLLKVISFFVAIV